MSFAAFVSTITVDSASRSIGPSYLFIESTPYYYCLAMSTVGL